MAVSTVSSHKVRLIPMTPEMYHRYYREYENDPDLYLNKAEFVPYSYTEEKVDRYIQRQADLKRIPLAIMADDEIVGEVIIKNIEEHRSAVLSISLKNAAYKDHGFGTEAEKLAVRYVFRDLDIPTLYADTIKTNTRSRHVLEKVGFSFIREDEDFRYYRIDRDADRTERKTMNAEKATTADIEDLVRLRLAFLAEDSGTLDEKETDIIKRSLPDYYSRHLNNDLFAYVIREDHTIVSCAFLLVVEKPMSPAFINGKTGSVLNVYTSPAFRHKGYARKVMEALTADAKDMGLSVMELKATDAGYPLYKSLGFSDDHSKYHPMKRQMTV